MITNKDSNPDTAGSSLTQLPSASKTVAKKETLVSKDTLLSLHFSCTSDLWLIIEGKVYDFSRYAKVHPGGDRIFNEIIASGDPDVTERWLSSFEEDGGHPKWVKGQIRNRQIGVVEVRNDHTEADNAEIRLESFK